MAVAGLTAPMLRSDDPADPWSKGDLLETAALANRLTSSAAPPKIICVAFPFLYRQRHILHAEFAGPANKPEGLQALRQAVKDLPKNSEIVIYCGCCPMVHCPNIRPAFRTLKEMGFTRVRVLDVPTNLHVDWTAKGYPVE
jgi:rhodanese-related sulfurtransferase